MSFQGDSIFWVEVEKVVPNPFQPRREFDEDKLRELADSIRMYGILQPLTVTRKEVHTDDGAFYTEYELIAGERRLRASKIAGLFQVPVLIRSGEDTEQEKLELAIIENLQREDLNAVDRALAFKQLAEVFKLSHSQVAKKVGRSREYVSNSIRLLALPEVMLTSLKRAELSEGHARTLLMLKDKPVEQDVVFREILLKKLSVREVERIARKIATDKVRKKSLGDMDAHLIEIEREFTDTLGTRVQILKTDFGGKLTIDYFEEADLEKLLTVMKAQNSKIAASLSGVARLENNDIAQTVIQEMDSVSPALALLEAATGLEVVAIPEPELVEPEPAPSVDEQLERTEIYPLPPHSNEAVAQKRLTNIQHVSLPEQSVHVADTVSAAKESAHSHEQHLNTTAPPIDVVVAASMPADKPQPSAALLAAQAALTNSVDSYRASTIATHTNDEMPVINPVVQPDAASENIDTEPHSKNLSQTNTPEKTDTTTPSLTKNIIDPLNDDDALYSIRNFSL